MWHISKIRGELKKNTNLTIDKGCVYVCKGCGNCLLKTVQIYSSPYLVSTFWSICITGACFYNKSSSYYTSCRVNYYKNNYRNKRLWYAAVSAPFAIKSELPHKTPPKNPKPIFKTKLILNLEAWHQRR